VTPGCENRHGPCEWLLTRRRIESRVAFMMTNTNTEIEQMLALAADHDRKCAQFGETEEGAWYRMSAESLRRRAAEKMAWGVAA
jgi:hypothetical protein